MCFACCIVFLVSMVNIKKNNNKAHQRQQRGLGAWPVWSCRLRWRRYDDDNRGSRCRREAEAVAEGGNKGSDGGYVTRRRGQERAAGSVGLDEARFQMADSSEDKYPVAGFDSKDDETRRLWHMLTCITGRWLKTWAAHALSDPIETCTW